MHAAGLYKGIQQIHSVPSSMHTCWWPSTEAQRKERRACIFFHRHHAAHAVWILCSRWSYCFRWRAQIITQLVFLKPIKIMKTTISGPSYLVTFLINILGKSFDWRKLNWESAPVIVTLLVLHPICLNAVLISSCTKNSFEMFSDCSFKQWKGQKNHIPARMASIKRWNYDTKCRTICSQKIRSRNLFSETLKFFLSTSSHLREQLLLHKKCLCLESGLWLTSLISPQMNDIGVHRPCNNCWPNYPVDHSWLDELRGPRLPAIYVMSSVRMCYFSLMGTCQIHFFFAKGDLCLNRQANQ